MDHIIKILETIKEKIDDWFVNDIKELTFKGFYQIDFHNDSDYRSAIKTNLNFSIVVDENIMKIIRKKTGNNFSNLLNDTEIAGIVIDLKIKELMIEKI